MCRICGQYSCPIGCPNFSGGEPFFSCASCGADIFSGDDYFSIAGENYCEECIYIGRRTAGE